ncbi:hypothetical protein CC85DRAFT_311790 [Cutaneotrichosporon oleaginosum]|uniref:Uncharacterized protein n=1 Tax=Cutaneotrichosporon oleaginosum TaxID=879819 RepID=A0A0J0XQE6_9TREE|nr:uncharacterized protein CC85DRAFT_311790 [Cutaneotrichosporon oleaginosum]KLT43323.1 hypothetical protein CC85DRAFT_311790 [Cutaneotrichosporon oleaginosum]TXT14415.1 hypothetical protein COLE_00608 [Cutaneotrichosporon oleaginosum]
MKIALPLIATLALVAANPVRLNERDDNDTLSVAVAVDGKCPDGGSVFQANGKDLCCPAGNVCDQDVIRPEANNDVDVAQNGYVCIRYLLYCTRYWCYYRRICWYT